MADTVLNPLLMYTNLDVDESEDAVLTGPGRVHWIHAVCIDTTVLYLKLYDATVATVAVGTTTPDLTLTVPVSSATQGDHLEVSIPGGFLFSTAITIAATTTAAVAGSTGPGANELIVNIGYTDS